MASPQLAEKSAFLDWPNERFPAIERRDNLTMASLGAFQGASAALDDVIKRTYGVSLPTSPHGVEGKGVSFLWFGPSQWLAIADRVQGRDLEVELAKIVEGLASVVDQTDARAVVEVSGPWAREVLATGVPIDLDVSVFRRDHVAITHASHIGVLIYHRDVDTYQISMFRSFADSFAEWIFEAGAAHSAF